MASQLPVQNLFAMKTRSATLLLMADAWCMIISMGNGQPGQITKVMGQLSGTQMGIMYIYAPMGAYLNSLPPHIKMTMIL